MLLFNIRNFDDFQYLFGIEIHGNGNKSRKNKILLSHLKNRQLYKYCREHDDYSLLRVRSMPELKKAILNQVQISGKNDDTLQHEVSLMGMTFYSSLYRTDDNKGLCFDLDGSSVRYINVERNREYKKKSGKFIVGIIKESEVGKLLNEQVINWLSEEFTYDWETYTKYNHPEIKLNVDDNFKAIYDSERCKNFQGCSCMEGRARYTFFRDSVKSKAAYLTDANDNILARAIIFTDVKDQNGKKWRLLERQYASESSEMLKRLLIERCVKEGYVDGYKVCGAACQDARNFVDTQGRSLADYEFRIECHLGMNDVLSYQDSFKWYDYDNETAFNFHPGNGNIYNLDITDYNLNGDSDDDPDEDEGVYDDWHDEYVDEVQRVYYQGTPYDCDTERLDDFVYVPSQRQWHHEDDIVRCDNCGEAILKSDAIHEPKDDSVYCSEDCRTEHIEQTWYYSQWDDERFPYVTDITTVSLWDSETQSYHRLTISVKSLECLKREGKAFGFGESWFIMSPTLDVEAA